MGSLPALPPPDSTLNGGHVVRKTSTRTLCKMPGVTPGAIADHVCAHDLQPEDTVETVNSRRPQPLFPLGAIMCWARVKCAHLGSYP